MKTLLILMGLFATTAYAGTVTLNQQDAAINPYTTRGAMMEKSDISTIPEGGSEKAIIDTTQPKITLQKFNGEVSMGVTLQGMSATGARRFLSKSVEWNHGSETMSVTPLAASSTFEDGGYAIDLTFDSEPATNIFNFSIDGAQNLDFFYQAPLWQEAGLSAPTAQCTDTDCTISEGTSHRPDNVVGSYAVYYKNHANHIVGQTNYATGKAYHIFRPLVTDANGATTWADLSYSNGVLTVTVPQSFLDSAVYPVTVDPTFGYTTHGGTQLTNLSPASVIFATIVGSYVASSGDTITNYSMWGNSSNLAPTPSFASFSVIAGVVKNQLDTATTLTINSGTDQLWTTANISVSPIAGTQYGIGISFEAFPASSQMAIDFDNGSAPGRFGSTRTTFPGVGNSFSPTGTDSGRHYSLYATYTAGGGSTTNAPKLNIQSGKLRILSGKLQVL